MATSIATLMKRTFPTEMTNVPLWLIYKLIDRGDGKFSKPPISPFTGEICSKTDEGMYTDFNRALLGVEQHNADGVGFVFLHGFIAIDLDNCFNPDGSLSEIASDIVDHFIATYMEYSPSGNGLHIFCKGNKPNDRTRVSGIEVYSGHNFVTVTGDKVPQSGDKVLNMQSELEWLFDKYLPSTDTPYKPEIINIDHGGKSIQEWLEIGLTHDDKFHRLYNDVDHMDDESGHDMALLCKLAYWLNRDCLAVEKVFFESPWTQSKDKRHRDKIDKRSDYFENTLGKALAMTTICAADNERKMRNTSISALQIEENSLGEVVLPLTDYTDIGNARAFADLYSEELAFTEEFGWCYFCGLNWELGQFYQAQQAAVEFAENVMYIGKQYIEYCENKCREEGCSPNSNVGKAIMAPAKVFMKHAEHTCSASGVKALLNLAEGMMKVPVSLFDGNPWVLNTPNVVVDLRTGEAYPPAWNHYNSMMTGVVYEPDCQNNGFWDSFLDQIFCGDKDLIDYIQLEFGAACVGKVYEENLLIANGCGSNGKSTLFNVLKAVLGDYCISVNPDILMDKVNYEQQIAITTVKGRRLVFGQETESGQTLSTASLKRMVSADTMIGRVLHRGYVEFEPTHTLMLATNHLPKVKDNDEGTWRRLTVVPFNAVIDRDNMITNYQDILISEDGAYILKWLIDGAIRFYEQGCTFRNKPTAIWVASCSYRQGQRNNLEWFCDECVEFLNPIQNPKVWISPDEMYAYYTKWCSQNGVKSVSKLALSNKLAERGMQTKTARDRTNCKKTLRAWWFIKIKDDLPAIEG